MRIIALIVVLLGVASLVLGVLFVTQAASAEKQITDSVAPLTLDQVNPLYDKVTASFDKMKQAEEPQIQAGKAAPSAMYSYLTAQRALLGLAKSNLGVAGFVRTSGIITVVLGLGLVLGGLVLLRKGQAA